MRPQTLLPILLGVAVGAGGWIHGWRSQRTGGAAGPEDEPGTLASLRQRIDLLERENASLRSLAQGGGEVKVPPPLSEFVEDAAGLDFQTSPVIHKIAGEELLRRVTASIESRFPPNTLDHRHQAWSRMGLLAPDDRFASQLAATYAIGARSWFDDQTGEAWVTNRFDPASIPDQASVVRALTRILLHQHFPPPPGYPGDEAARARNALHHGVAINTENRFLARQALGIGFDGVKDRSGALDLLENLPPFIRGLATFPSQVGSLRTKRLAEAGTLLDALHDPPRFTAVVAGKTAPDRPLMPPADGGNPVLEESAGWLGLRLWLGTLDPDLEPLADAWRGDGYRLTARSETRLDLVWDIALEDPEAAAAVANAALAMAGFLADLDQDPALGETVTTPTGGRITIGQPTARTVRFSHLAPR